MTYQHATDYEYHDAVCTCGSGLERRELKDARGIFCTFVCDDCESRKKQEFLGDIFTNPEYETSEDIEGDFFDDIEEHYDS